eukprot:Blabericola_migrator_1__392@NODE_1099_length_5436_cov_762_106165_g752_i0_p4_GENE_NODE_1099_length_5436_cov_762_106165_g752_i0NODE_1099_length_5436_cov_762_106165_g752_i0_p4_ORF_typecomplete_len158_score20_83_NODE_1099_length_5436_cov_762_106165_g752_i042034676
MKISSVLCNAPSKQRNFTHAVTAQIVSTSYHIKNPTQSANAPPSLNSFTRIHKDQPRVKQLTAPLDYPLHKKPQAEPDLHSCRLNTHKQSITLQPVNHSSSRQATQTSNPSTNNFIKATPSEKLLRGNAIIPCEQASSNRSHRCVVPASIKQCTHCI